MAKKQLNLPVTLITDVQPVELKYIDNVVLFDKDEVNSRTFVISDKAIRMNWKNLTRSSIYELSPYDRTLLIDCDFFMFNNSLAGLFESDLEFACYSDVTDLTQQNTFANDMHVWATVMYFTKSKFAESVFGFMKVIKDNYEYYSLLRNMNKTVYRNDLTLDIALKALAGYTENLQQYTIPGKLPSLSTNVDIVEFRPKTGELLVSAPLLNNRRYKRTIYKFSKTNVHIMNKLDLLNHLQDFAQYA